MHLISLECLLHGWKDHYRNKQVLQNLQKSELNDRDFRFSIGFTT